MLVLREIEGLQKALGDTSMATSPLWNMAVDKIMPVQLIAFREKLSLNGREIEADAAINYAIYQLNQLVKNGSIERVAMLDYREPNENVLTSTELINGFAKMHRPLPAAILFGLEMNMPYDELVTLTWPKARLLQRKGKLTDQAQRVLDSQPINIATNYVFWRYHNNKAMPLFGLEQTVFDCFNRVWAELQRDYRYMVFD